MSKLLLYQTKILGLISIFLQFGDYFFYFRGLINKTAKPHFFTWFIWGISMWIVFFIQYSNGAEAGSWATAVSGIFTSIIALVALFQKNFKYSLMDWISLFLAFVALTLWLWFNEALYAIVLIVFIDLVGYIPMLKKSYKDPFSEPILAWMFSSIKYIPAIMAMGNISFITILYPLTLIMVNSSFTLFLLFRRNKLK